MVRLIFDGNNLSYVPGRSPSFDAGMAVRSYVLDKLEIPIDETLTIFDCSVYGFCGATWKKRLKHPAPEDRHFVAPSTKEADEYILTLARETGAMVVTLDNFKDYPKLRAGIPLLKPGIVNPTLFILPHTVDIYQGKNCCQREVAEVLTSGVHRQAEQARTAPKSPAKSETILKNAVVALLESHGGSLRTDALGDQVMHTDGLPEHLDEVVPNKTRRIARLLSLWPDRIRLERQEDHHVIAFLRPEATSKPGSSPSTSDKLALPVHPSSPSSTPSSKTRPTRAEKTVRSAIQAVLEAGPMPQSAFFPRVYDQVESKAHLNTVVKPGSGAMKRLLKAFPDLIAINKAGEVVRATKASTHGPHMDLEDSNLIENRDGSIVLVSKYEAPA